VTVAVDGYVHEVFRSIQGEGPYVGVLQTFVRFSGCSTRCRYCDSRDARRRISGCAVFGVDGSERLPNPVAVEDLFSVVCALSDAPGFHSMSATGGEPLEQPEFLAGLLKRCRAEGIPVYLETNGLHEEAARAVAGLVDHVSLDLKLPSLCPDASLGIYRRVLPLFEGIDLFCKAVVAEGFSMEELVEAARIVGEYDRGTIFVIQPATPMPGCGTVGAEELLACHAKVSGYLDDVRVIPQCHRLLGFK
jgi:organic radical activating enzyme